MMNVSSFLPLAERQIQNSSRKNIHPSPSNSRFITNLNQNKKGQDHGKVQESCDVLSWPQVLENYINKSPLFSSVTANNFAGT